MAIYVYDKATGALVSYCPEDTDPVADAATLAAQNLVAVRGLPPLDDTHAWDAATRSVVIVKAPPVPRLIGTGRWVLRFTPDEFDAISTSTDKVVKHFMYALNRTVEIDLNDPSIMQGVGYLASIGLIQPARVAEIMA